MPRRIVHCVDHAGFAGDADTLRAAVGRHERRRDEEASLRKVLPHLIELQDLVEAHNRAVTVTLDRIEEHAVETRIAIPRTARWSAQAARGWSRRPSGMTRRGTSTRSITRTPSSPTWCRARTASGGRWSISARDSEPEERRDHVATPKTMMPQATMQAAASRLDTGASLSQSTPISAAKITEVSRKAETAPSGARVLA